MQKSTAVIPLRFRLVVSDIKRRKDLVPLADAKEKKIYDVRPMFFTFHAEEDGQNKTAPPGILLRTNVRWLM
jgi:hypothetical protein